MPKKLFLCGTTIFFVKSGLTMTANYSLLSILHDHALSHGDYIAHLLPDRVITYRRFWSRIERASARLQGEWGVVAGDTVIYWGSGHPDAIILYCALLRLGAKLMPCEDRDREYVQHMVEQTKSQLVVHDDALTFTSSPAHSLSSLLADWCHFDPVVIQDESAMPALYLHDLIQNDKSAVSIGELIQALSPLQQVDEAEAVVIDGPIFHKEKLINLILPALIAGRRLQFSLIESLKI
jgi:acyl-CoA synthetase (AMP-forming)/AMP-acid ligase II